MPAASDSPPLSPRLHYAWIVLGITFVAMVVGRRSAVYVRRVREAPSWPPPPSASPPPP